MGLPLYTYAPDRTIRRRRGGALTARVQAWLRRLAGREQGAAQAAGAA